MPLVFYTLKRVLSNRFRTKHSGFYALHTGAVRSIPCSAKATRSVSSSAWLCSNTSASGAGHCISTACRVPERSRTLYQHRLRCAVAKQGTPAVEDLSSPLAVCPSGVERYFGTACTVRERSRALPQHRLRCQDFFAILDQESFSATVRLNTGWSGAWTFGSE